MYQLPEAVRVNVNPSFRRFDRSLLNFLSSGRTIAEWQYCQIPDESPSLEVPLTLLQNYLKKQPRPVHLLGHGMGGTVALLYARRHPERVKSLTLLSVGVYPAIDWQAHYYALCNLLPCSRNMLLTRTVYNLFGLQSCALAGEYRQILEQDLLLSPSPHTLYRRACLGPGTVPVPLLVCGGERDSVIDSPALQGWRPWLKEGDRIWSCEKGRYFFQYSHPYPLSQQIFDFWRSLSSIVTGETIVS